MHFESINPRESLKELVKEIWVYENQNPKPEKQKIIPDGFSEIIFHYGDPYQINLSGRWELQSQVLFSSQISKFFFLRNTGASGMIGLKLYPTSFYEIFGQSVERYTDKVMALTTILGEEQIPMIDELFVNSSISTRLEILQDWLEKRSAQPQLKARSIVRSILDSHGMVNIDQLAEEHSIGLRQAERLFKKIIGLTPKFFSRIVRFNYIFKLIESMNESWIKIALQSGYFDQSHFIKNFKEFTGEEPTAYGFEEKNLANFFLKG